LSSQPSSSSSSIANNNNNKGPTQEAVYQELGEPTLCMHAELGTAQARVLLRTRILLRDAYQRQGDNIITWCEPYYEETNQTSSSSTNKVNAAQSDGPNPQGVRFFCVFVCACSFVLVFLFYQIDILLIYCCYYLLLLLFIKSIRFIGGLGLVLSR
jgi:hypothetical protein